MTNKHFRLLVEKIDAYVRQNKWFDFHLWRYDGRNLIISGGIDLTYSHNLEIVFTDVFYSSIYFEGWRSDTTKGVIEMPRSDRVKELNEKFEIEQGYQLFIIKTEDFRNDIYIAAKEITYNTDTVYYYLKEDLKSGERLSDGLL